MSAYLFIKNLGGTMKILSLNITDIKPYENNPRVNDQAVDKVAASIAPCFKVSAFLRNISFVISVTAA